MLTLLAAIVLGDSLDLKRTAEVKFPALSEISGIVKGKIGKDLFWVHNDSGDSARIFAIHSDGKVIAPNESGYQGIRIEGAKNVDWEDIAIGGGNIYVSDLGNNGNKRKDLGVYVFPEPDPTQATSVRGAQFLPVAYPDQKAFPPTNWNFDCEAVFVFKGKLHILTKHRALNGLMPGVSTNLYRLNTSYTDKTNVLAKLDSKDNLKGWVTAADVSPDGRWLAVLTHMPRASVWIFDTQGVGDKLLSKPVRWVELQKAKQCEAICFDGNDHLIIANEQRDLFRIKVKDVEKI